MKPSLQLPLLFFVLIPLALSACTPTENSEPLADSQEMSVFEGTVFVASTDLVPSLWSQAGWQISDRAINSEQEQVPVDCTLYPHYGVSNQWIGSCAGRVFVPRFGAQNIAVMLTAPDGAESMVQVAP